MVRGGYRSAEDPWLLALDVDWNVRAEAGPVALGVARCPILPILLPILCSKTG